MTDDPYAYLMNDPLTPETLAKLAVVPRKIQKRRQQFVIVPWGWIERLAKTASANTYRVALHLLYEHWRGSGQSFLLPNGMLAMEGVTRFAKWRALAELEELGLVSVEKRPNRSPKLTVHL
jgi:hypothetical protein